ncbi:MAG: PAS domain S-box protein [Deltaproteobacteria bacterium]|nr:PAS domain S-box protein [Deltaproteobacteria bacterium]
MDERAAKDNTHLSLQEMSRQLEAQEERLREEIAKRTRTEEMLKASEEKYRSLVESSSDSILVLDRERRVLSCNQAFLDLFGYERREVEGQSIRIIHGSDESFMAFGRRAYPVIEVSGFFRTEWNFVNKAGTPFPVETVTSAMRSADGTVKEYTAIIRDITTRRLMEDALKDSEANYRLVIDNANESIVVAQDGMIAFANAKALESTGYTAEELSLRPFTDFLHPEDREMAHARHLQRLRGEAEPGPYPIRILTPKGDLLWAEVNSVLTTWRERPATLIFLSDITKRKRAEDALRESEQRLRMIIEAMPVLIHAHDTAGDYVFWNKECERVTGYTSEEIVGNPRARELLYPDLGARKDVEEFHREVRDFGEWELPTTAKDGSRKIIEWTSRSTQSPIPGWLSWETGLDVTERRYTEAALKASEERYRDLYDNAPVGYHEVDIEGRITRINRTELDMLGYNSQDMLGRHVWEFIQEEISHSQVKRKLAGDIPIGPPFERTYRRKDGAPVPVLIEDRLIRNNEGQVMGIRSTIQDITELKRVRSALLESEAQKRAILDASIDRIRYVDEDMRILWANRTTTRELGVSPEDLVGEVCHRVFLDRDTPCEGCPTVRARESGRIEKAVMHHPSVKGIQGETYWETYCVPLKGASGEASGYIQIARDITVQRLAEQALLESEAKHRTLIEQIPAITYTAELDDASTTLYVSPQIESMIGFTQAEYARDPDIWRKQLHPEDRDRVLAEVVRTHEIGEPLRTEYRMFHQEGHVVWLRDEAVIVKDPTGRPLYLQGVMFDVSERKRAEEQVHILNQELMRAHERERRMIALELHDRVAQDLSTVKIGLDTLLYSWPGASAETKNLAAEIFSKLQGTITAVRDLAYDLRPPILDQMGLVQSIYQYCEDFSEKTGLIVDFTCAGIDGLRLDPDTEINLYRLVQEGLINVKKHAEATRVIVRLVASFPNIILRISDDGKGFDVEERRRSVTTEKRMGLHSMEERGRWLGGAVHITSRPGKGTRIAIQIPYKEKEDGPQEDPFDRG